MKRALSLLLAAMLLLLAACGPAASSGHSASSAEPAGPSDPYLGVYKLSGLMGMELSEYASAMEITPEEAADSLRIELKEDGQAVWTIDGEAETIQWTAENGRIVFSAPEEEETMEAVVENGALTMDMNGTEITFQKQD